MLRALLLDVTRRPALRLLCVAVGATILVLPGLSTPGANRWEQGPLAAEAALVTAIVAAHLTAAVLGAWYGGGQGALAATVLASPRTRGRLIATDILSCVVIGAGLLVLSGALLPPALLMHDVPWLHPEWSLWSVAQALGTITYYAALGHLLGSVLPTEGALFAASATPLAAQFLEPILSAQPAFRWVAALLPSPLGVAPPRTLVDLQTDAGPLLAPIPLFLAGCAIATIAVILLESRLATRTARA